VSQESGVPWRHLPLKRNEFLRYIRAVIDHSAINFDPGMEHEGAISSPHPESENRSMAMSAESPSHGDRPSEAVWLPGEGIRNAIGEASNSFRSHGVDGVPSRRQQVEVRDQPLVAKDTESKCDQDHPGQNGEGRPSLTPIHRLPALQGTQHRYACAGNLLGPGSEYDGDTRSTVSVIPSLGGFPA